MPISYVKAALRHLGIEVMSTANWQNIERSLEKADCIHSNPIDFLSILIDAEFKERAPFFVQVGANDGVKADPLSTFIRKRGWSGILIEPQPDVFDRLKLSYGASPQLTFSNVAIAKTIGNLTLFRFGPSPTRDETPDVFTTFDRSKLLLANERYKWDYSIEQIQVPTTTLECLLDELGVTTCDLLVIDTEGMDFEVIQTLNFSKHSPRIIQFEYIHLPVLELRKCLEFLSAYHYRFARVQGDVIAYHDGILREH